MFYIGINVAKDKHNCCILGPDGKRLSSPFFTVPITIYNIVIYIFPSIFR